MEDITQILENLGGKTIIIGDQATGLLALLGLLKIPLIVILVANVFFAIILILRARILEDTVSTMQSKIAKGLILTYLAVTIIGSLLAILFLILG